MGALYTIEMWLDEYFSIFSKLLISWLWNKYKNVLGKCKGGSPFGEFQSCKWQILLATEVGAQRCSIEKVFLEISQNSQENRCARVSFLIKMQASFKKETLAQVLSCKCYEISKNTFAYRTPPVAASMPNAFFPISIWGEWNLNYL